VPEEGKGKMKERRKVGEGDDTITIEDTSDDEDVETLQEPFQQRSRFSHPGLPNIPLIVEKPASLVRTGESEDRWMVAPGCD
jgi:hypothetical protein